MPNNNIPKVIHYCWFGGKPLPPLAEKCIASWRKYLPDYEIKRWDESNFDVNIIPYTAQAYEAKKYAFVSDYARYKILYEYGGIYLDTDVELLKSIDDILEEGNFMGCENYTTEEIKVNPGLGCAVTAGNKFYAEIIGDYKSSHFVNDDGSYNLYTVVQRTTDHLKKYGLKKILSFQTICGINIYPAEYFSPKDMRDGIIKLTNRTVSIHHYSATWVSNKNIIYGKFLRFIYRYFGPTIFNTLRKIFGKKQC